MSPEDEIKTLLWQGKPALAAKLWHAERYRILSEMHELEALLVDVGTYETIHGRQEESQSSFP